MNLVIMVPPWGPGALRLCFHWQDSRRRGGTQRALGRMARADPKMVTGEGLGILSLLSGGF